jgi:hypothetical protein
MFLGSIEFALFSLVSGRKNHIFHYRIFLVDGRRECLQI